jgi:hypothetical protein
MKMGLRNTAAAAEACAVAHAEFAGPVVLLARHGTVIEAFGFLDEAHRCVVRAKGSVHRLWVCPPFRKKHIPHL